VARSLNKEEKTKGIPIILVTGIRHEMNLPFGFEPDEDWLPVKAVLEKPIKPEVLLKTVEDHIKNKQCKQVSIDYCDRDLLFFSEII
jgi:response regulator RpfG family c-di-GMP phosphodiesterase